MENKIKIFEIVKGETIDIGPYDGYCDEEYYIRITQDENGEDIRAIFENDEPHRLRRKDLNDHELGLIDDYFTDNTKK